MTQHRQLHEPGAKQVKKAIFAQGCFWGPDGIYPVIPGVLRVRVGYLGGTKVNPTYTDLGDHTEGFVIEYDPTVVTFTDLLKTFWTTHDPTEKNKTQYKSVIYYGDNNEKKLAEDSLKCEQQCHKKPIVTEILPVSIFYNAEDYHQKYMVRQNKQLFESLKLDDQAVLKGHVIGLLNGYVSGRGKLDTFDKEYHKWGLTREEVEIVRAVVKEGKVIECH